MFDYNKKMGFSSWMKKTFKTGAQNAYNKLSRGVKTGYNAVNSLFKGAGRAAHWLDDLLSHKTGFDIVDDVLALVKDNPIYADVIGGIDGINNTLDDVGQLGSDVDRLIRGGLGFNQQTPSLAAPNAIAAPFNSGFVSPRTPSRPIAAVS